VDAPFSSFPPSFIFFFFFRIDPSSLPSLPDPESAMVVEVVAVKPGFAAVSPPFILYSFSLMPSSSSGSRVGRIALRVIEPTSLQRSRSAPLPSSFFFFSNLCLLRTPLECPPAMYGSGGEKGGRSLKSIFSFLFYNSFLLLPDLGTVTSRGEEVESKKPYEQGMLLTLTPFFSPFFLCLFPQPIPLLAR